MAKTHVTGEIVGLGMIVVDHQMVLSEYPAPDTKQTAIAEHLQVGGPVPTALALLSRFGHRCAFVGSWGGDYWGRLIEDDLARERIETQHAVRGEHARSGVAQVWIDQQTGSRTVAYRRSEVPVTAGDLNVPLLQGCAALHLDGWPEEAALEAARIAKQGGGCVSIDTGTPKPGLERLLRLADVVNCPSHFPRTYFGHENRAAAARELLSQGPRVVTLTDGVSGAWLFTPEAEFFTPALPVTAVDTTGAGDVFAGALLHAVLTRRPPEAALRFAVAAAGLKCRTLGNRAALPSLNEVEDVVDGRW